MLQMPIGDLLERVRWLGKSGQRVDVLWQESKSIGFLARGREYRSEPHVNPSDPAGIAHSPRFAADAFALILERRRRPGEVDRFQRCCPGCDALLHEEGRVIDHCRADPVSKAYQRLFADEQARTCKRCGAVMPRP
jgi:3-hydroxyanthranilate 3,4-dioxygenase